MRSLLIVRQLVWFWLVPLMGSRELIQGGGGWEGSFANGVDDIGEGGEVGPKSPDFFLQLLRC